MTRRAARALPIFDLDGTLLDSDAALTRAFVALGIPEGQVSFGHVPADECLRLGISLPAYLDSYDTAEAAPFPGVSALVGALGRWAVCSNKASVSALAELDRLGWMPEAAAFSEDFGGPKRLEPILRMLAVDPAEAVYVGDTHHDRTCAEAAGVRFVWAGWNPRTAAALPAALRQGGAEVAWHPLDVLAYLAPRQ
jgi:HAD superfamily hydrolase (TIGR01549 family)